MRSKFCGREADLLVLQQAWEKACNLENPEPQLRVILGESGLGKTRLVQEFYHWLSTTHDPAEPAGYWPDDLGQEIKNLDINPSPADCNNSETMPFLWWGVRLNDPGEHNSINASSALTTFQPILISHLNPVERRLREVARQIESGKSFASAMVDAGLSLIPGGGVVGMVKLAIEKCVELSSTNRENKDDQQQMTTGQLEQRELKSLSDRIVGGIEVLVTGASKTITATPVCLLIDDAQFSNRDPSVSLCIDQLLQRACQQKWPLMIVVTHWEAEWKQQFQAETGTVAAVIHQHQQLLGDAWHAHTLGTLSKENTLAPMLQNALPGLTAEQQAALLERAGGNPRYLDEIIRLCQRCEHYFEDEELSNALTQKGFDACLNQSLRLHQLIEERFSALPKAVRRAISLSSLQGQRFLTDITLEVAELIAMDEAEDGLHQAENPHSMVSGVQEGIADFSQRIFHDIARSRVVNEELADAALRQVLRQRLKLPDGEQADELALAVAAGLFEKSEDKQDRQQAALALVEIIENKLAQYDYVSAGQDALRFIEGIEAGSWNTNDVDFWKLWHIHNALKTMGSMKAASLIAETMREEAEQRIQQTSDDHAAQRQLAVALDLCGDLHRIQGDHQAAMQVFGECHVTLKQLAKVLNTPKARMDLTVSYHKIGNMYLLDGDHQAAMQVFKKCHVTLKQLAKEFNTPEARRDLSISYRKIGDMYLLGGDHQAAMQAFENALKISEQLEKKLNTPEARRDLSVSYHNIGDMYLLGGDHQAAMQVFERCHVTLEQLAKELNTPEARRNLSLSYNKIGDMYLRGGKHQAAMQAFENTLKISEQLEKELNTPEARRDLSVSYNNIGDMYLLGGDYQAAMQAFEKCHVTLEQLAKELNTPGARRDLSISYGKIGDMYLRGGDHQAAMQVFEIALEIREQLAKELNTPEARRDLSLSYNNIGDMYLRGGDHQAAMQAFEIALEISEQLAKALNTPEARRDLSLSILRLADMADKRGDIKAAKKGFQQYHNVVEQLAKEMNTPEARRDLSFSYNKIGDMYLQGGDYQAAMQAFENDLTISEQLAKELNTPEARRDLAVSHYKFAQLSESSGDLATALKHFQTALTEAKQFQTMAPCPDADHVVDVFTQEIQRLKDDA